MPSKLSRSKIVKKLDAIFSQYIRLKDADHNGDVTCLLVVRYHTIKKVCNVVTFNQENTMQPDG